MVPPQFKFDLLMKHIVGMHAAHKTGDPTFSTVDSHMNTVAIACCANRFSASDSAIYMCQLKSD